MAKKILIIEDEPAINDIIAFNLDREGYDVSSAYDGADGLEKALSGKPDLILLDVMLPKMDGFEVCKAVREKDHQTPILMLTAREDETDKVLGLEIGADDYITKPFSMKELMARVKANIRRTSSEAAKESDGESITVRDLRLHPGRMEVTKKGSVVDLTQREYDLLLYLCQTPDRVVSREELMQKVWNYEFYGDLRAVDVTVRRLREKIEDNPADPVYILTRRGVGYIMGGA